MTASSAPRSAMIFAAGLGTRLGSLTKDSPKCLVPVGGAPILEHVILRLKGCGIKRVVINLHHFPGQVKDFLHQRRNFGLEVLFSEEQSLLDTGGGLRKASEFFSEDESLLVHNADVYSDVNLQALIRFHQERRAIATLAVMESDNPRVLLFDERGRLRGWRNADTGEESVVSGPEHYAEFSFLGIQVISSRLFRYFVDAGDKFSIIQTYLRAASFDELVLAYPVEAPVWYDIGTPETLAELRRYLGRSESEDLAH